MGFLWDISWVARAKARGGWGVGCLLGDPEYWDRGGPGATGLILRLAILGLRDREDLDSEQELQ